MRIEETALRIVVLPKNCTGCRMCQLQCSFSKTGMFNPSKAFIMIDYEDDDPKISFSDNCDGCGICVRFCVYDALVMKREE